MEENYQLPILIEKDEDGFYVAECNNDYCPSRGNIIKIGIKD